MKPAARLVREVRRPPCVVVESFEFDARSPYPTFDRLTVHVLIPKWRRKRCRTYEGIVRLAGRGMAKLTANGWRGGR
jgi:hypothetical protein